MAEMNAMDNSSAIRFKAPPRRYHFAQDALGPNCPVNLRQGDYVMRKSEKILTTVRVRLRMRSLHIPVHRTFRRMVNIVNSNDGEAPSKHPSLHKAIRYSRSSECIEYGIA